LILEAGTQVLEKMGYNVLKAGTGFEAIEVYRKRGSMIDLVILDVVMPEMGGGETFDRLKEIDSINPAIK